jgi:hypothetical protein
MNIIYLAIPYAQNPKKSKEIAGKAQRWIYDNLGRNVIVLAPQLTLEHSYDEATEREEIMKICLDLVDKCSVMLYWTIADLDHESYRNVDTRVSEGVHEEMVRARNRPILHGPSHLGLKYSGAIQYD